MAEEIINIATLTVDNTRANESAAQTKKAIFDLQEANAALRKDIRSNGDATGEQTKKFVENEQELKRLSGQYKIQSAALNDLTLAELKENEALTTSVKSREQAVEQTKELKRIRQQLDVTTLEGVEAMKLLNEQIDRNDEFLRASGSSTEKAAAITGNYRQAIFESAQALNPLNGGLEGFATRASEAGGAGNLARQSFGGMATGLIQLTKAALGFILTPVGLVITALVVVFVAIQAALARSEEATNKVTKVFGGLKAIAGLLLSAFSVLGEYFINSYIVIIERVADATEQAAKGISKALSFLGFEKAAKSVDDFTESTKGAIAAGVRLAEAEAKLEKEQRKARLTQLEYQKEAEKFRQLRDDETKTIGERIKANEALGLVLKRQLKDELKIAQLALEVANARILQEGRTKDTLDSQADALTQIADIQERVNGQESEQLVNRVSLQKDANAKAKEYADAQRARADKATQEAIKSKELAISIEREKNEALSKTDSERLVFLEDITQREIDLLNFKKGKGVINAQELSLGLLQIQKTQSAEILAIAADTVAQEIKQQNEAFAYQTKLTEEQRDDEIENAQFLREIQTNRVAESLLSEADKTRALVAINQGYVEAIEIIDATFAASSKSRDDVRRQEAKTLEAVEFETRILLLEEQGLTENELAQALLDLQLEQKKAALDAELAAETKTALEVRSIKELEEKKYAAATKKIDLTVSEAKKKALLDTVKVALGAAQAIFGDNKALAVASALINTYEGITAGVKLGYPAAIPAVAAAAATGFAAVKNILKTDKGAAGATSSTTSAPVPVYENTARTQSLARVDPAPVQATQNQPQVVLVVETLDEVKNQQQIKIKSV